MVKLAKPTIRGTSQPRREMSLRFNALLSRRSALRRRLAGFEFIYYPPWVPRELIIRHREPSIKRILFGTSVWGTNYSSGKVKLDNVSIHRARTSTLNIETRPRKGSVCNALLSRIMVEATIWASHKHTHHCKHQGYCPGWFWNRGRSENSINPDSVIQCASG